MSEKKYFWLKMQDDFFSSVRIKKLRRMAGGDTYTIIYLKMQLKALKSDGILTWTGLESDFAEELALDIDEAPEDVKVTLSYLLSCGLAETSDQVNFFLPYVVANTGSETSAAQRMRESRAKTRLLSDGTKQNTFEQSANNVQDCYTEIEKEKKKEKEKNRFIPPTLEEVKAYVAERNSTVNAEQFFEYYTAGGWKDGKGNPVRNWKQKLLTWEKHEQPKGRNEPPSAKFSTVGMKPFEW